MQPNMIDLWKWAQNFPMVSRRPHSFSLGEAHTAAKRLKFIFGMHKYVTLAKKLCGRHIHMHSWFLIRNAVCSVHKNTFVSEYTSLSKLILFRSPLVSVSVCAFMFGILHFRSFCCCFWCNSSIVSLSMNSHGRLINFRETAPAMFGHGNTQTKCIQQF